MEIERGQTVVEADGWCYVERYVSMNPPGEEERNARSLPTRTEIGHENYELLWGLFEKNTWVWGCY